MKTSYSRAWGMRAFHTCISEIYTYREYGYDITKTYIINKILAINSPQMRHQMQSLQQVRHQMRVWGNGEEGMRGWGDR